MYTNQLNTKEQVWAFLLSLTSKLYHVIKKKFTIRNLPTPNDTILEDLIAETQSACVESWHQYDLTSFESPEQIVYLKAEDAFNRYAKDAIKREKILKAEHNLEQQLPTCAPESSITAKMELKELYAKAMKNLKPEEALLVKYKQQRLKNKQIGELLNTKKENINTKWHRLLQKKAKELNITHHGVKLLLQESHTLINKP